MFVNLTKEELKEIYIDFLISKNEGNRCESLVPYAEKYKIKFGDLMSLREALNIIIPMFLEEVAKRYFAE